MSGKLSPTSQHRQCKIHSPAMQATKYLRAAHLRWEGRRLVFCRAVEGGRIRADELKMRAVVVAAPTEAHLAEDRRQFEDRTALPQRRGVLARLVVLAIDVEANAERVG